jgi:hypothetical protein
MQARFERRTSASLPGHAECLVAVEHKPIFPLFSIPYYNVFSLSCSIKLPPNILSVSSGK